MAGSQKDGGRTATPPAFAPTAEPIQKKDDKELTSHRFRGEETMTKALNNQDTLELGDSGAAVTRLQEALIAAGHALPVNGANGQFNAETETAVKAYQTAHGLKSDGKVGQNTMGSLDKYLRLEPGSNPMPPAAGSTEADLRTLLAKGNAMTGEEAARAKSLLFRLDNDAFRVMLKEMMKDGSFATLISNLGIGDILSTVTNITHEVVVPITHFKPAADTIDNDFKRANEIYNPIGIEIEKGDRVDVSEKTTKKILNGDTNLNEFTTNNATAEELELVKQNRVKGRITGYWVPNMDSSRGEALIQSSLGNLPDDRASVVVNESAKAQDTFPHELGHVLGLPHHANANHMMASGGIRNIAGANIDQLDAAEIATIKSSAFLEIGKLGIGK